MRSVYANTIHALLYYNIYIHFDELGSWRYCSSCRTRSTKLFNWSPYTNVSSRWRQSDVAWVWGKQNWAGKSGKLLVIFSLVLVVFRMKRKITKFLGNHYFIFSGIYALPRIRYCCKAWVTSVIDDLNHKEVPRISCGVDTKSE